MADKKILVVDDEEDVLEMVGKVLTSQGYEAIMVTTAEDALNKARTLSPDLILIDIILPDMEGPEVICSLSEDPLTRNIPAIFFSGIVTREQEEGASDVRVGGRQYKALSKPFSAQELMMEIRKILE